MEKTLTLASEIEKMSLEERIHVVRRDLTGAPLSSAKLLKAAFENNWDEAEQLLEAGADPRICRRGDAFGAESALYFALKAGNFEMARKLFEAGDRLDDLVTEGKDLLSAEVLSFLASEMRRGDNYFYDESRSLSECCRISCFPQIRKLLPAADQEELNRAFVSTVHAWMVHFRQIDVYADILKELLAAGAKLSDRDKEELLILLERRFGKCPQPLHPGREAIEQIIALIQKG